MNGSLLIFSGVAVRMMENGSLDARVGLPTGPKIELIVLPIAPGNSFSVIVAPPIAPLNEPASENNSGYFSPNFTAPKPPIERPAIARLGRLGIVRNFL